MVVFVVVLRRDVIFVYFVVVVLCSRSLHEALRNIRKQNIYNDFVIINLMFNFSIFFDFFYSF